jgi:hypothetical protein
MYDGTPTIFLQQTKKDHLEKKQWICQLCILFYSYLVSLNDQVWLERLPSIDNYSSLVVDQLLPKSSSSKKWPGSYFLQTPQSSEIQTFGQGFGRIKYSMMHDG